ncbi:amidohydrolase (macronuclear) [Tetrahymena thermophila SB210]|uniref:Amidohydrolase n=1 Tax=Tetrahymena thermophila (strain SB210) TaxID=312017 RepID=I7MM11_TETTS|nr:amidohydrolase [Tetrahymena thermophila SB210]EAS03763.2 amidohydrolase [Tetrahymena thermophila SB210]|eukprot:XP_001024008.2 amidohydrolase [Tetrahymena thermophila SB210]
MDSIKLRKEALEIEQEVIQIRRHIHENPELGFEEFETSKFIAEKLEQLGYEIIKNVGITGVVGILRGDQPGPCVLFRADMDALKVDENSGDPHASKKPGIHHACGHDGHVAMLLGFAKIISTWKSKIKGIVKLCFQPAEEGLAGAKKMIEEHVLENPNVDMCFGAHLVNYEYPGYVRCVPGPITANSDRIFIDIEGLGGHASTPQDAKDAVVIGCQLVTAMQTITSRNLSPYETGTISIGKIESGTQANVIASKCRIEGTVRSFNQKTQSLFEERLNQLCNGFAISYDCKINLVFKKLYPATINDQKCYELAIESIKKVVGESNLKKKDFGLAGEDFSFFSLQKPSCYFCIGSAPQNSLINDGTIALRPHHSPFFTIDESSLVIGVSIWVQMLEDIMC